MKTGCQMTSGQFSKRPAQKPDLPQPMGVSIAVCSVVAGLIFFPVTAASAQKAAGEAKIETGKSPSTIFSIEVPGPVRKTDGTAGSGQKNPDDPQSRERAANQYFKAKQKQSISARPKVKEASMRLSGSLCPACLKALAVRFQKTDGVIQATVELPSEMKATEVETSNAVGKLPRYAVARVTYDANVLSIERIKDIVRTNDLAFWKVLVTDK